ncbi:LSU ribosomal protein L10p (P0) [Dissulfuribacter thermophilus]|uniref:Large ribosomal subunit protein uL10 n=1 Tax=Dissulfuribacter thermophilus TaxID=1156395 RepID=A0A1B9F505_9BACT|nr:50S ribosomal protein L10 [Dissulfuribacter thermophilus]OCC15002.1 LSU ribosomal protein L10p (P0) [Dissulfuribacter thermophilus]
MALTRKEKEEVVKALHEKFESAQSVILTKFSKMTVSQSSELRKKMRDLGGEFKVSKNTLFKIAARDTQVEVISDKFVGQNAVVIAYDDPVAVAKALLDFAKDNEVITIEGGVLNGKVIDAKGVEALSKLPTKEVLLAQLLSVLLGPQRGLVQVLAGVPRKFLYALNAIKDQKSE